ncbi:MAG TPA: SLC13 family permease [Longimicrobiales bacterium]|nr:SLC13 family permease [Longimicrobiales bacterium]
MVLAVFAVVYLGMFLGELPRLQVDRAGLALLGAIALLVSGAVTLEQAVAHVDVPTLALLFGMMVLSAQLRMGGVYAALTRRVGGLVVRRRAEGSTDLAHGVVAPRLLAVVVALVGTLSAVFTNDIVALAVSPVVVALCLERELDPVPFLLAVACAANVGSAATLVGNPQNILVGQALGLSFVGYLARAALPSALGLAVVWGVVARSYRGRWARPGAPETTRETASLDPGETGLGGVPLIPHFHTWQAAKGLALAAAAMACFLFTPWPRELVALAAAGIVLTSRRFHSRDMLGLVDWQLLVLFMGLFVVNGALADTGLVERAVGALEARGVDPAHPGWLFALSVGLSNTVSNVPAVMLLLPVVEGDTLGALLALSSTLAGNLIIVGSIANIIVVEQARAAGITVDWRTHARVGVPVTLLTLALSAAALAVMP